MRIIGANVNGIRSAARKGFVDWAAGAGADLIGLQELKAQPQDLRDGGFERLGDLVGHFHCADKKGYSGVALYSRALPSDVVVGLGDADFDAEGRWVECRFDTPARRLSVVSVYFPSGTTGEVRQQAKYRFLDLVAPHLAALKATREFVLVGDVNIAHHEIDLKNWRGNQKNSGFLPAERAWLTRLFDAREGGLVDVFRRLDDRPDQYTWWSARGNARANNVGWRIDYHLATPALAALARRATIVTEPVFSDHAPLVIDYDMAL